MVNRGTIAASRYIMTEQTNIDHREVLKFDEQAHRWWDPEGDLRTLHAINPLRLNYVRERAGLAGKRVLDVGCGGGILAESMAREGASVVGIDAAENALEIARLHQLETGVAVDYRETTPETLARELPRHFQVITCMEMLEHVPSPGLVVKACAELLAPGGDLFFSTLSRNPKSFLFAIVGAEYLLRLLPVGTHDWRRFIRPSELDRMARRRGLALADLTGLHYNPLSGCYWLGPGVEVNYLAHYRRPD